MKLQKKLLLSYLIVVLLPLLGTTYFLIERITKETINQSYLVNQANYEQLKDNVKNLLSSYIMLSDNISNDNSLIQYLNSKQQAGTGYGPKYFSYYANIVNFSNKYLIYSFKDVQITLYSSNKSIIFDHTSTFEIDKNVENTKWYKDTLASKELNTILTPFIDSSGKYKIPITRIISRSKNIINIVKIDIPETLIWELIKKESENKNIYISNTAGDILTSTSRNLIGIKIYNTKLNIEANSEDSDIHSFNIFTMPTNLTFNELLTTSFPRSQFRVITTIPSASILGKTNEIIRYGALVCLISIIIAIIFILIFSRTLVSRLKQLVTNMGKINEGNFDVYVSYEEKDEIGELSRSFKKMLDRLDILINEVYTNNLRLKDLELGKKEAKLQALQSQMNPHFLFNTLESIRMNVLKNGDVETSEIIESFGKLLRTSIEWKNSFLPLDQELELVEKYLKIQCFRYRNRFSYNINISNNLRAVIIPKFILQPIIENAIYHGVEMKKGLGIINVDGCIVDNALKITVQDNGVGISKTILSELILSIQNPENISTTSRIGMHNVNQRIKLLFGINYGVSIFSKENNGTKVEILLPLDWKGES